MYSTSPIHNDMYINRYLASSQSAHFPEQRQRRDRETIAFPSGFSQTRSLLWPGLAPREKLTSFLSDKKPPRAIVGFRNICQSLIMEAISAGFIRSEHQCRDTGVLWCCLSLRVIIHDLAARRNPMILGFM